MILLQQWLSFFKIPNVQKLLEAEARRTVQRSYELEGCVTRQLALMDLVASRSLK
jgi:hypothetical protein